MPRDPRPYITYPIGYTSHPRWELHSDKAFRALHEMQDYCRQNNTDGKIDRRIAEKRWAKRVLVELVAGVDDRPLIVLDEDSYLFRSYGEHQMTAADIEDLRTKRSLAGSKGGKAQASARANAEQTGSKKQAESKSESKEELLTDVTNDLESSHLPSSDPRGRDEKTRIAAEQLGITDPARVAEMFVRATKQPLSARGSVELATAILSKAKSEVRNVDAYLASVCRKTPLEVAGAYFDLDIGAVA